MPEIRVRQCANALPASRLVWASLVTTAYHMLNDGTFHHDLGADFLVKRDGPERPMWVNSVDLGLSGGCPLFPRKRRRSGHAGPSGLGQERRSLNGYSISSSAWANNVGGTSMSSARAVCRLMTSSNLAACWIGRSAGFSPFSTRPV
jgi:hypothetical protein